MIRVHDWNETIGQIQTGRLPVDYERAIGAGGNLPQGRIPNRAPLVYWKHPFFMSCVWNDKIALSDEEQKKTGRSNGCWCLHIVPGLLNGHPPAIRMWGRDIPDGTEYWGNGYGKQPFKNPDSTYSVLLTDDPPPFLKLVSFVDSRAKLMGGKGAVSPITPGEVPLFFRVRGAKKPEALDFGDFISNLAASVSSDIFDQYVLHLFDLLYSKPIFIINPYGRDDGLPDGNRLLYRCDIVLKVDRPTIKQNFIFDDIGLLRFAGITIELPSRRDYSAQIYDSALWEGAQQAPSYWDIIFGTFVDFPFDEIVLGTVWFLSPIDGLRNPGMPMSVAGTPIGDTGESIEEAIDIIEVVDGTWMPFVQHNVFWNLNYSSIMQIDSFKTDLSLEYFKEILSVLAGGVAWLFAASIVNPIEATYDQINNAHSQTAVKGMFWTG